MQIDTNLHYERIAHDCTYTGTPTETKESLSWSATKQTEGTLARITKVQERSKGDSKKIRSVLLSDEFRQLNEAIQQFEESTAFLHLIEKAPEWTDGKEERHAAALFEIAEKRGWENSDGDQREA